MCQSIGILSSYQQTTCYWTLVDRLGLFARLTEDLLQSQRFPTTLGDLPASHLKVMDALFVQVQMK
jgi:hypothetical protein